MIPRLAEDSLLRLAKGFPILAITGPRQSGKTTIARQLFAHKPYLSLENPDTREFATSDPKGFLQQFSEGAILDEVQRVPSLLSWLQGLVDDRGVMCDFVITGSAQFELNEAITQSLAGRVGRVELLPFQVKELLDVDLLSDDLDTCILRGGYPSLYDRDLSPQDWFANYCATYVERDVRNMIAIKDLNIFQRFMGLVAGRSGQQLNVASLASDTGVSQPTAAQWLTVLEASYLIFRLPPYFENLNKRLTKSPKLYFVDTGLLCWLLGIHNRTTLANHPLRGAIFETYIVSERYKQRLNEAIKSNLHYWRDSQGVEIDLVDICGQNLVLEEIKSGMTFSPTWLKPLRKVADILTAANPTRMIDKHLVYGGAEEFVRSEIHVYGWRQAITR